MHTNYSIKNLPGFKDVAITKIHNTNNCIEIYKENLTLVLVEILKLIEFTTIKFNALNIFLSYMIFEFHLPFELSYIWKKLKHLRGKDKIMCKSLNKILCSSIKTYCLPFW